MKNLSFGLLLAIILLSACRHQPELPEPVPTFTHCVDEPLPWVIAPDDTCSATPFPRPGQLGYNVAYERYTYVKMLPNPSDPNEVAFYREDQTDLPVRTDLGIMNLCTGESRILASRIHSHFDWSPDGWIAFVYYSGALFKIKANGDSLTQIAIGGINYWPTFNQKTGDLLFRRGDESPWPNWIVIKKDGTWIELDSTISYQNPVWSPDGKEVAAFGNLGVNIVDMATGAVRLLYENESNPTGISWTPDGIYLFISGRSGLTRVNTLTGARESISENCENRVYYSPHLSSDGKKLFAVIQIWEYTAPPAVMHIKQFCVVMEPDGTNEQQIVVPE